MSAAANSAAPEPLELEIFSLPFRLRAPRDEHDRLQRSAKRVDTVMRELVSAQPSADTTRLAIQAAFLIATESFRQMDEFFAEGGDPNKVSGRVDDILRGLDIALARMDSALQSFADSPAPAALPSSDKPASGEGPVPARENLQAADTPPE